MLNVFFQLNVSFIHQKPENFDIIGVFQIKLKILNLIKITSLPYSLSLSLCHAHTCSNSRTVLFFHFRRTHSLYLTIKRFTPFHSYA